MENKIFYLSKINIQICFILYIFTFECMSDVYFDPSALEFFGKKQTTVDLTAFEHKNGQLPGVYRVNIVLNNESKGIQEIEFFNEGKSLYPYITLSQLERWGVDIQKNEKIRMLPKNKFLTQPIETYFPKAKFDFAFSKQQLNISIPQYYMNKDYNRVIASSRWDDGITALFTSYTFNGAHTKNEYNEKSNNYFVSLNSGLNIDAWRLRNLSTGSYSERGSQFSHHWNSIKTVLMRDIAAWKSRLSIGQTDTNSEVFDSIPFTGIQLATEPQMWPDNLRSFAPKIKGIASSSSKVTIKQNNNTIYQTYVPAGAFEIDDLPASGGNGDLIVIVEGDNGKTNQFTVAYSSLAIMQREGQLKYAVSGGEYTPSQYHNRPLFGQVSAIYGLPYNMTIYGGTLLSANYQSVVAGVGSDLGKFGAISFDVTDAYSHWSQKNHQHDRGQSYRFQYSKNMLDTGSTLTLAAYRYSTPDYYSFNEFAEKDNPSIGYYELNNNKKNRMQINLTQQLGDKWGALFLNSLYENYWNKKESENTINAGYSNSWKGISYNINYANTFSSNSQNNQQVSVNVSIPLSRFFSTAWANYSINTNSKGKTSNQVGIYGTALERNQFSYNITQSYTNKGEDYSGGINLGYTGKYSTLNGGYNYTSDTQRVNYGASGSIVLHSNGLTLSQPMNGMMTPSALIHTPEASDIAITNGTVKTDWRGYAIVPYLSAYRNNNVTVDTLSLKDNVDILNTNVNIIPSGGAIVLADFKTRIGQRVLIKLNSLKRNIPFGAIASIDENPTNTSIVGDNGEVYFTGLSKEGHITVKWGSNNCKANYKLIHTESVNQIVVDCK